MMIKKVSVSLAVSLFLCSAVVWAESYENGNLRTVVKNGSGASAVNIQDGGNSITVDGTVSITGVATAANQTTIIGHVDGLEGLLTTIDADTGNIATYVDGLEAFLDGVEATLTAIDGRVDGLEADTTAIKTATELLDDIIDTDNTTVPGTLKGGLIAGTDGTNTQVISVNSDGEVGVNDGGNSLTVDGTVSVTGVALDASVDGLEGSVDGIEGILTTIDADTSNLNDTVDTDNTTVPGTLKGQLIAGTDGTNTQVVSVNSDGEIGVNDGGNSLTVDGTVTAAGGAADSAAVSGNPNLVAGKVRTADETTYVAGDTGTPSIDINGKIVTSPYSLRENSSFAAQGASNTDTTSDELIAAQGSGVRACMTQLVCSNGHATVGTYIYIEDGSESATKMAVGYAAAAGGGFSLTFPSPVCSTANTAVHSDNVTTGSDTRCSAAFFKAP